MSDDREHDTARREFLSLAALASGGATGSANWPALSPSRLTASVPTGFSSLRVPPSGIFSKSSGSRDAKAAVASFQAARSTSPRALCGRPRLSEPILFG